MALNDQQKAIVNALHGTVNVMAGAGTGKTFTLTQRIVSAVADCISRGESSPMDRIMAITFTEPAAAELKSRVRSALFERARATTAEESNSFLQAALSVDNSWISTIHAMAGRILRENAIEFGIDPEFEIAEEQVTESVRERAFENAISSDLDDQDQFTRHVLDVENTYGTSFGGMGTYDKVKKLLEKSETMPRSVHGVILPDEMPDPTTLLSKLIRIADLAREHMREDDWTPGEKKNAEQYVDEIDAAIARALELESAFGHARFLDADFPIEEYVTVVHSFPTTTNKFGSKSKAHTDAMIEYRETYRNVSDEVLAISGLRRSMGLLSITADVNEVTIDLIQRDPSTFEFGETLRRCLSELQDPANAAITQRYRDQFDFIMVDEFQDTDKLQMRIIETLSRAMPDDGRSSGSRLANVCTVGDMQQSIYRFRGGDVEESVKRVETLRDIENSQFELSCNYRSHEDILQAVEEVFAQEEVFGADFLSLSAAREHEDEQSIEIFSDVPRVQIDFVHATKKAKDKTEGVSKEEAVACVAIDIAERFKALADAGVPLSKMAVLLGKTTNAGIFAAALRAVGLESVIAGGSVFQNMPEAQLAAALLRFAANQADEASLVECLISPLFAVADDALLAMVTKPLAGKNQRTSLGDAYRAISKGQTELIDQIDEGMAEALQSACKMLSEFVIESDISASNALRNLIAKSGYLMRLEEKGDADSLATAGNLVKAIGVIESLEQKASGKDAISRAYSDHLMNAKEPPGLLSTTESDFVRIMTVHKSKGLEFDHVAVAELKDGIDSSTRFIIENIDDETYLAQASEPCDFTDEDCKKRRDKLAGFDYEDDDLELPISGTKFEINAALKNLVRTSKTPLGRLRALTRYNRVQELEEARRLLYVAMTRARESLIVANAFGPGIKATEYKGIFNDVMSALTEHFDTDLETLLEMSSASSELISFKRLVLVREEIDEDLMAQILNLTAMRSSSDDASPTDALDDASPLSDDVKFEVPIYPKVEEGRIEPFQYNWKDVASYSSLSAMLHDGVDVFEAAAMEPPEPDDDPESDPTALGTAFHRLMQLSIENAIFDGSHQIVHPSAGAIKAQASRLELTLKQEERLKCALNLMFSSKIPEEFAGFGQMGAEVPFCVDMEGFYLQGEIDALADDGHRRALILDYKTGYQSMMDEDAMRQAHQMQAMCYAYALLSAGFETVEALFIHVETPSQEDASSPAIVKYSFGSDSIQELCNIIEGARVYP